MINRKVCAVIVTYNRKEYLKKLIAKLAMQTYPLENIFIFDNFSSDGTNVMLKELGYIDSNEEGKLCEYSGIYYYRNNENTGGSGGFHKAIEIASILGYDYLWCMDDDVLPDENCLAELMKHISEDARICIPSRTDEYFQDRAVIQLNKTNPFKYTIGSRKVMLYNKDISNEIIEVDDMPFEGPLIAQSLIDEIGLPKSDFFIIFDDTEYATRARRLTKILYCKNAILHKQIIPQNKSNNLMGWKEYYAFRNQIWFDRNYGENIFVKILRPIFILTDMGIRALLQGKTSNLKVLMRAYKDGINDMLGKTIEPGTQGKDF